MISCDEMVYYTFSGYSPKRCADEYHLAVANITAVYGPRGHKRRTDFKAVVDLDYTPVPKPDDACVMMLRVRTRNSKRFKVLPVEFCDFAVTEPFDSPYLSSFEMRALEAGGFESTSDDDVEPIIAKRIYGKQDETDEEIAERCREESEARELEERYAMEDFESITGCFDEQIDFVM